jgi:LysR family glycine cleavage system transcriptional activator
MKRGLLPLNGLRIFDAAARHLSFRRAADELGVTPAAVSQQIRALEDYLGTKLFVRTNRGLIKTDMAARAQEHIDAGLEAFQLAVKLLRNEGPRNRVKVSVNPPFASKWLVPRLGAYYDQHPDMEVHVSTSLNPVTFDDDSFDLAIRYGRGNYPGLFSKLLLRESVSPVCSPAFLDQWGAIETPEDLIGKPLIHDDSLLEDESCPTWLMWLKAAGVSKLKSARPVHFDETSLAIDAAIAGRGVVLTKNTIAAPDLAAGRLVRPLQDVSSVDFAYFLVCPQGNVDDPAIAALIEWLEQEAERSSDVI